MQFTGLNPAMQYAAEQSKKQNSELYVVKSLTGGLNYQVKSLIRMSGMLVGISISDKILAHFKNGLLVEQK